MDFKVDPRTMMSNSTQQAATQQLKKAKDLESLKESCQEFEALYVMEMFKAMRKTVPDGGLLPKTQATEVWRDMLDMETARQTSKSGGLGIADAMYRQMAELIENKS